MGRPLSRNIEDADARPYFLWDEDVSVGELRRHLASEDARLRGLWQARVMREARYQDVWKFLRLRDVLSNFERIEPHLGRMRAFWNWLIDGWRKDGLLPRP
jgi:hypothetical protein